LFSAKYAVKTVSRRKKRNMLTILGLAIGVAMIASAQIATDTLIVSFTDLIFSEIGDVDVIVGTKDDSTFNQTVYDLLANDPAVQNEISQNGITPRLSIFALATDPETGQIETSVTIWGINDTLDTAFGKLIDIETEKEVFVKDLGTTGPGINEVIIGRELANALQAEVGQTIVTGFTNKTDQSVNYPVTIKHIVKNTGKVTWNGGNTIFVSLPTSRTLYGANPNEINTIFVDTKPGEENSDKTVDALENALENAGILQFFDVTPLRDAIEESVSGGIGSFETLLLVFGSFVIVSGIILIINIFLMNVEERKRTTGILRAVGMKKGQVINSFLTEAIILGIIGAFIGVAIGLLIGYLLAWYLTQTFATLFEIENFTITLVLKPSVIIVSVIAGIILAIIAGVYPAIRASRVDIVETLKGIEKPKRKKAGKRSLILGALLLTLGLLNLTGDPSGLAFLLGSILTVMGIGIAASTYITKTKAWDFIGAALIATGATLMLTQLDQAGDAFFIGTIFTVIAGGIILIGINLEIITDALNKSLMRFQKARAVSLFSTKYVGKQKTRSTLTFAIFAIILSMNVGMAIFATSSGQGFDRYAEKVSGGADIIATAEVPMPQNTNTSIKNLDPDQIEYVEAFPGTQFAFFYDQPDLGTEDLYPSPIYAINQDLEQNFNFEWTEKDENALARYGTESPWQLLAMNATTPDGKPYAILYHWIQFGGAGTGAVGTSIWLRMEDGTGQEFVIVAQPSDIPTGIGLFTSAQMPVAAYAPQVRNNEQSIFIIKTTEKIDSPQNKEIAQRIEAYGNLVDPAKGGNGAYVYGIEATTTYEIYEEAFSFNQKFLTFLNAFVFTGFFVGVIGLLVVAIRSVSERKREIGMMRSIGFRQKTVVRIVLLEILIVALLGLALGIINGILVDYAIFKTFLEDFDFIIPWDQLALFIGITLAFSFIAAWYPGRKASRIPPSEALRYVG